MSAMSRPAAEALHDPARPDSLVFAPLRAAVVATAEWRREQPEVPAGALPQFLAIVREGLGDQLAAVRFSETAGPPGAKLWPAAAKLLRAASCPPLWSPATGLTTKDFETVRTPVAQLLSHAAAIESFVAQCEPPRPPPEPRHVRTLLDDLARGGAPGFRLALVTLLRRCPRQENLAALALSTARGDDAIEEAAYSAATHVLDVAVARHQRAAAAPGAGGIGAGQPGALTAEIADAARLTRCIEAMAALRPLSRLHREVGRKRVILQTVCLDRVEEQIAAVLLQPLAAGQAASPGGLAALRKAAAELGAMCDALRLLGDRHGTERAIQKAARRAGDALGGSDPQGSIANALIARLRGVSQA